MLGFELMGFFRGCLICVEAWSVVIAGRIQLVGREHCLGTGIRCCGLNWSKSGFFRLMDGLFISLFMDGVIR